MGGSTLSRPRDPNKDYGDNSGILVIGIDFGTTYSGVAWATEADLPRDNIIPITSWPGGVREEGKTPTEILYKNGEVTWGFEIGYEVNPIKWFKLLILKDEDLTPDLRSSKFLERARQSIRESKKTLLELISDYLQMLWKHAIDTITKERGSAVDALQFHVVLTVPAIWKDYAGEQMMHAVMRAGILNYRTAGQTQLSFAPEPQAAALATLHDLGRQLQPNEIYIVCDAGGGTVDLITYKIGSVDPLLLEEAVPGTGGLCGRIFIDQEFKAILQNRLGRKWDRLTTEVARELLHKEWELSLKPRFKLTGSNKKYTVQIPAEAFGHMDSFTDVTREPYIKNARMHLSESHIKKAFAKVFKEIDELVDNQVGQAWDKGLQPSRYCSPPEAGPICRGAVYQGFLPTFRSNSTIPSSIAVTSTISRASYGHEWNEPFVEGLHLEHDKHWNPLLEYLEAQNQMKWYLIKGENVLTEKRVLHKFSQTFTKDRFDGTIKLKLCRCEADTPPTRWTDSVERFVTIECKTGMSYSDLEEQQNSKGQKYVRPSFYVQMVPSGAAVEFAVYVGDKKVGSSNVNIQYS
ncbi:uncharacterized protein FIESC28_05393 [Fusarium coffeatum]|uniref:Uncharacterized protein n=1 Tax=Fusarium coffeatum TaxID=231269 RepID=A0A366RSQ7_9HYPO|nr:uncharacterized protein FIESC28_05393 [Fusarium coffeatum]RBR20114.1 hypothetical protein FIESC28_05393 [Fusarium coffeatum]